MSYQITQARDKSSPFPYILTIIIDGLVSTYECESIHDAKVLWLEIRASLRES